MPLPVASIHCLEQIFSPFSGLPAEKEEEPNEKDPTLLFIYYGDAAIYAYVSKRVHAIVDGDVEDLEIEELTKAISIDGGLMLEVDTDWNGVNFYGFAPVDQ